MVPCVDWNVMDDSDEGITQDELAIGPTRPSMVWPGVTYTAILINIFVVGEAVVWTSNIVMALLFFPIHGICFLICRKDPRGFELMVCWLRTKFINLIRTRWYWNASSCSPLALRKKPGLISRWKYWRLKK